MKKEKKIYWVVWKQRFESRLSNSTGAIFKQPFKTVFVCMSLVFIFTGNVSGSPLPVNPKFVVGNLNNPMVAIPGKSSSWNKGVAGLVNQVLNNIPPEGNPKIGVFDFKAMETNETTEFSSRLKEDFIILLSQVESLQVKEVGKFVGSTNFQQLAKENGLDYFVKGFYKHGIHGLSIWSQLISTSTGHIVSSGKVAMAKNAIFEEDLALLDRLKKQNSAVRAFGHSDNYDEALDHLIALKPNETNLKVKIWTDKKEYKVGEKITFFVKAEKPCYLILFDVRPDGQTNIIFPNQDSKGNFIQDGETYQVPVKSSGIEFRVQGPAGLERIKALVSSQPGIPLDLDWRDRFYPIEKNSLKGVQDINRLVELFSKREELEWTEAYMEVFIYEKNQSIMRGSRRIPLIEKPKKPIDMIGTMGKELERE
jgi:TolB-like protein